MTSRVGCGAQQFVSLHRVLLSSLSGILHPEARSPAGPPGRFLTLLLLRDWTVGRR